MIKIIITGKPTLENAIKAVNEKADGYVLKPFDMEVLLEKVRRLLGEKENEYLRIFGQVAHEKASTPAVYYRDPDRW